MFTSTVAKDNFSTIIGGSTNYNKKQQNKQRLLAEQGFDNVILKPILDYGAKLMDGQLIVKKILSEEEFVVYHEELRTNLVLTRIEYEENLDRWIMLPPTTNIVTLFDTFEHKDGHNVFKFSLTELTNHGDMYRYIQGLNLNLGINIPLNYMEVIYDCMIQITIGMEYAHDNGLVHGTFGLKNVVMSKDGDTTVYKITNFTPGTSMKLPVSSDANFWPFVKGRKKFSEAEKLEILMLKDIYSIGICLLELMIGRYRQQKFSISLDSLPLTWAEYAESTPLIQVLIECIQLDAISQRKGKLAQIRNLLIKNHAKFFNKDFYKMSEPFIGKKSDVLNKRAIAALFRKNEERAEMFWEEALDLNDKHFDTQVNYAMYNWKYAKITDDELLQNLEENVFKNKHKGHSLEGIIHVALGEKAKGLKILENYNNLQQQSALVNDPSENIRRKRAREHAKEIYNEVNLRRNEYFQNVQIQSGHESKIDHIQFTPNGKFLTTTSKECVKVWQMWPEIKVIKTVDIPAHNIHGNIIRNMATLDDDCTMLCVYESVFFFVKMYAIDLQNEKESEQLQFQGDLNIMEIYEDAHDRPLIFDHDDLIKDMRFRNNGQDLRFYLARRDMPYHLDFNIHELVPSFEKCDQYEDKSIFKYGQRFIQYSDSLKKFLNEQSVFGSTFAFPEKDPRIVCELNREEEPQKYFRLYDVFIGKPIRKILKQDFQVALSMSNEIDPAVDSNRVLNPDAIHQSDSFDVDAKGQVLVYAFGLNLRFQNIRMPDSIKKHMAPQFKLTEHKYSPARVQEVKQAMKDKIRRDLKQYYELGDNFTKSNQSSKKQKILQVLTYKYNMMCENKRIIQANDEFLTMAKLLLKEDQPQVPIIGVENLIKLQTFDKELIIAGKTQTVDSMQVASQVPMNIMFIAIKGKVYKYNLVTKQCLFQFATVADHHMMLYDFDDKLLVADSKEMRLWDFFDSKEEVPELVTYKESSMVIQCLKVNKYCEEVDERRNVFYYVVSCKDDFQIYHGRLELLLEGSINSNGADDIVSIEFGMDTQYLYFGTKRGRLYKFELPSPKQVRNEYPDGPLGKPPQAIMCGEPIDVTTKSNEQYSVKILYRLQGVKEEDFFVLFVKHSGLKVWQEKTKTLNDVIPNCQNCRKSDICEIKATPNGQFVVVGYPEVGKIIFFKVNLQVAILEELLTIQMTFDNFQTDDNLTMMLFQCKKKQTLELYAIKWTFDSKNLDVRKLKKYDNEELGIEMDGAIGVEAKAVIDNSVDKVGKFKFKF